MTEGDGRQIDPRLGVLEGEGAQQLGSSAEDRHPLWEEPPTSTKGGGDTTYYELPSLKEPVWIWAVPAYFYAGGAAGAAAALGMTAQLVDGRELRRLVVACRRIAAAGTAAGTALLIIDLGRPARFFNMLRVFRPTSPLSVGSWILAAVTPLSVASVLLAGSKGKAARMGDTAGLFAGLFGLPLAGYTAVLLSSTAVPLWANVRRTLPALFVSSALSSATSLLGFARLHEDERRIVERIELIAGSAELLATFAVERDAQRVEEVARPLKEGVSGRLWQVSTACTIAGLAVSFLPGKGKLKTIASSLLGTTGSGAMRYAIFYAGKASSRSPRATFHSQRKGHGGAEVTGSAAATGPDRRATDPL